MVKLISVKAQNVNEDASVKVEAVIFDWDGTLIDLDGRELYCINKALASVGSPIISVQRFVEGYYLYPYKEVGARNLIRKILGEKETEEKAFIILKALKSEGISLAVTTLRKRRMLVEQEIQYLQINRFVDVLVTREDIEFQPRIEPSLSFIEELRTTQFKKALTMLQKQPSKTIIVGDSWWDIRAAKRVRAITAWVRTGFGAYNDFGGEQPDITLNNLEELLKHI